MCLKVCSESGFFLNTDPTSLLNFILIYFISFTVSFSLDPTHCFLPHPVSYLSYSFPSNFLLQPSSFSNSWGGYNS